MNHRPFQHITFATDSSDNSIVTTVKLCLTNRDHADFRSFGPQPNVKILSYRRVRERAGIISRLSTLKYRQSYTMNSAIFYILTIDERPWTSFA
jgi:hypothetical protein